MTYELTLKSNIEQLAKYVERLQVNKNYPSEKPELHSLFKTFDGSKVYIYKLDQDTNVFHAILLDIEYENASPLELGDTFCIKSDGTPLINKSNLVGLSLLKKIGTVDNKEFWKSCLKALGESSN